jgi:Fic family protein
VKEKLLNLPILYLSRYINQNKNDYYRLLQEVRERNAWEEWVLFILEGVVQTSKLTIQTIEGIKTQMQKFKIELRSGLPKIYNQDLLNNLFRHPYTKIEFIIHDLGVSRPTATRYLEEIVSLKLLKKVKIGKDNYYVNEPLFELLATVNTQDKQ